MMEAPTRNTIFALTAVLEGGLLLVAAVIMNVAHVQLLEKFQLLPQPFLWGLGTAAATTTISILCLLLGKRLRFLAELQEMSEKFLSPLVSVLGFGDIVFIALVSGFCEEVLFRGVLQPLMGLWVVSILFGFFHDPSLRYKSYLLFTFLAGLALGYLYQVTGNLWSCITAHVVHNFLALIALRYWFRPKESSQ